MKILRITDRVSVKEGDIEFIISPLTHAQKMVVSDCMKIKAGQDVMDYQKLAMTTLKYSIKGVNGVTNYDDTKYELAFDESGILTDECVSELMSSLASTNLFAGVNLALANKFEEELDGVVISVMPKK